MVTYFLSALSRVSVSLIFCLIVLSVAMSNANAAPERVKNTPRAENAPNAFTIINPTTIQPASAGKYNQPTKIAVRVSKPDEGLSRNKFSAIIGNATATVVTAFERSNDYVLEVRAPNQAANGLYNLTVRVNGLSHTRQDAVLYTDTGNVDVDLVIDRSGSMDDDDKMNAAIQAAKQFVDFMQVGDKVGVVDFDDNVNTTFPLAEIVPPSGDPPLFSDNMESGTAKWSAGAPWAQTTATAHTATHAWTDSPSGSYANSVDVSLVTSATVNIPNSATAPLLSFWQKYETEANYDFGYVEVSADNGVTWDTLRAVNGTNLTWHKASISLLAYKGQSIRVRFRLQTDSSVTRDGWYVDDVVIEANNNDVREAAKSAIDTLTPDGATSIGGGLQRGQEQLVSLGSTTHPWSIVLMTDGLENSPPYVNDVLPAIVASKTVVHTIGLGGDVDEALLLNIASQTGGTYNFAPAPDQLAEIYNTIAGAVANLQVLVRVDGVAQQGVTEEKNVLVDSSVSEAVFSVNWTNGNNDIDLTLRKPNGTIVTPAIAASDPDIEYISAATYEYYRVRTPALVAGTWKLRITGGSVTLSGKGVIASPNGEAYIGSVKGTTDLTLRARLGRGDYFTNEPVKLIISLSDTQPILNATVNVSVQPPTSTSAAIPKNEWVQVHGDTVPRAKAIAELKRASRAAQTDVTLYDDGAHGDGAPNDGIYANVYTNATVQGTYQFTFNASGTSNSSETFTRQAQVSTFVATNTCSTVPTKPKLTAPANNSTASQKVKLKWKAVTCAREYKLVLKKDSKKKPSVLYETIAGKTKFTAKNLPRGHTYFWQVKACNGDVCVPSKWWSFRVP